MLSSYFKMHSHIECKFLSKMIYAGGRQPSGYRTKNYFAGAAAGFFMVPAGAMPPLVMVM